MFNQPAPVWNLIAETQPIRTGWAQLMFPLDPERLEKAIDREHERLTKEMGSDKLATAYLAVMPLLWEAPAIRAFKDSGHYLSDGIVPLETVQQAVIAASRDYGLTMAEQESLDKKLRMLPEA